MRTDLGHGGAASAAPDNRYVDSSGRIYDGCAWCGAAIVGTLQLDRGHAERDGRGRQLVFRERRVPVCARHRDSLQLQTEPKATTEAKRKISARTWRGRQAILFDGLVFQTGAHQRGWWEP